MQVDHNAGCPGTDGPLVRFARAPRDDEATRTSGAPAGCSRQDAERSEKVRTGPSYSGPLHTRLVRHDRLQRPGKGKSDGGKEAANAIATSAVGRSHAIWHYPVGTIRSLPGTARAKGFVAPLLVSQSLIGWDLLLCPPVTQFPSGPCAPLRQGPSGACGRTWKAGRRDLASPGQWHLEPPIRPAHPMTGARVLPVCAGRKRGPEAFLRQPEQQQHGGEGAIHEPIRHGPLADAPGTYGSFVGFAVAVHVALPAGERQHDDRGVQQAGVAGVSEPGALGLVLPERGRLVAFEDDESPALGVPGRRGAVARARARSSASGSTGRSRKLRHIRRLATTVSSSNVVQISGRARDRASPSRTARGHPPIGRRWSRPVVEVSGQQWSAVSLGGRWQVVEGAARRGTLHSQVPAGMGMPTNLVGFCLAWQVFVNC